MSFDEDGPRIFLTSAVFAVLFSPVSSSRELGKLRRARRRQRQHRIDRLGIAGGAQFLGDVLVAEQPRDPRQRLQMVGPGALRRQQQEYQIDRLAIHRLEIDRAFETGKQSEQFFQLGKLAVRDGDTVADGGGAEFFRRTGQR